MKLPIFWSWQNLDLMLLICLLWRIWSYNKTDSVALSWGQITMVFNLFCIYEGSVFVQQRRVNWEKYWKKTELCNFSNIKKLFRGHVSCDLFSEAEHFPGFKEFLILSAPYLRNQATGKKKSTPAWRSLSMSNICSWRCHHVPVPTLCFAGPEGATRDHLSSSQCQTAPLPYVCALLTSHLRAHLFLLPSANRPFPPCPVP